MIQHLAALFIGAATAQTPALKPEEAPGNYALCLETARAYPEKGLELAQRFASIGGGEPAKHCEAVALIGLRRFAEAATQLESVALTSGQTREVRSGLLAQAAQAWTLDGKLDRAEQAQTAALTYFMPGEAGTVPLLVDRAVTYGSMKRYDAALADLNAALAIAPRNAEALTFRASAQRALKNLDAALKDAEAAVALDPKSTDALLERGIAHRLKGNPDAARRDWRKIVALDPQSDTAAAAKEHLAKMEEGEAKPAQ